MAKRAYSPKDVANIKCKALPFEGQWKDVFGQPEEGDTWFISGPSASGKSSFVMQFAKMLCGIGSVLYVSLEEGVGLSMQRRLAQFKMSDVQGSFRIITDGDIKALEERLAKPKSAKFIIVDSYQYAYEAGWEYSLTKALPIGKPAIRLKYAAGVKVRTQGFRAYCQGRYSGNVSEYYTIWAEKAVEVYNDKSNN